jgi:hypothetical protein
MWRSTRRKRRRLRNCRGVDPDGIRMFDDVLVCRETGKCVEYVLKSETGFAIKACRNGAGPWHVMDAMNQSVCHLISLIFWQATDGERGQPLD